MIKRFAQMMKWPNLADTLSTLRQGYEASNLDAISSHAMAFFSGLVLPGVSHQCLSRHQQACRFVLTVNSLPSPSS